jgi:hypothetical protein
MRSQKFISKSDHGNFGAHEGGCKNNLLAIRAIFPAHLNLHSSIALIAIVKSCTSPLCDILYFPLHLHHIKIFLNTGDISHSQGDEYEADSLFKSESVVWQKTTDL